MMLPAASFQPFGSSPSSRRIQRIQNPAACSWIQPPTPLLAHAHGHNHNNAHGPGVLNNNNGYPQLHQPHQRHSVLNISPQGVNSSTTYAQEQTIMMSGTDSKETAERMRQSLPFPNAMLNVSSSLSSSSNSIFRQSSLADMQKGQSSSSHSPFPFNQTPCTSFSTNATTGAFVFSGGDTETRRKRKSLDCESRRPSWKKRCPEEKMVAHMSRLTLNNKAAQMIGKEDHLDDDDEWEDEEDGAPFQIGISPELQCALRGNEIIPEKLLSSMPRPNKSGMELVIWRPPGTIIPSEIIASITLTQSEPNRTPSSAPSQPGNASSSSPFLRDPVLRVRNPNIAPDSISNLNLNLNPNSNLNNNLIRTSNNIDVSNNDMEMETI